MGIRVIVIVLVLSGLGIYWGGTNFVTALKERDPLEITCSDYLKQRPENRYLRLTQCWPDLDNTAIMQEGDSKKVTEVYIPLHAKGATDGPAAIVVKKTDSETIALVSGSGTPTEAEVSKLMTELTGPNEGLVQFGMDLSEHDRGELKKLHLGLADDFVIMDSGKSPKLLLGALALAAGLGGLAFIGRGVFRRMRGTPA